ncbi:MAG: FkbM family methyltransferase [Candidatus Promineofilum sp.]|nr:FkbM family methyltransferase [Promineifilum sp.]
MIKSNLGSDGSGNWRAVAASAYRELRPAVDVTLVDVKYRLRREARPRETGDRDYRVLQALARGRRCILDVGANVGLTMLVMSATMADDGRIITFEASEDACALIRANAALNGLADRVLVVNALIAERSGLTLDFYGDAASGSASIIPGYLSHHRPLRKVTLALDDFIAQSHIAPELIKIDVEGAELQVIAGLEQTMRTIRPDLFVELHAWGDVTVAGTAARLLPQLAPLNYCMVYLHSGEVVTDATVFTGRGRCHVLLCPCESSLLDQLATLPTDGL